MGEQNRRAVDLEGAPGDEAAPQAAPAGAPTPAPGPADRTALEPVADERQTERQAPASSDPGGGVDVGQVGYGEAARP